MVKAAIRILEKEVQPKYNIRKKISHLKIHKQKQNKYYKVLKRLVEYADDVVGDSLNSIESVIRDYLFCIHDYYAQYRRSPTLLQISPSPSNQIRFMEWIEGYEREYQEPYLCYERPPELKIIKVDITAEANPNFIEV